VSAFLDGTYFTLGEGHYVPKTLTKPVIGKSVDGEFQVQKLHLTVSDTLMKTNAQWYTTLEGIITDADTIPITVGDSTLNGTVPMGTLVAVRQRAP